MTLEEFKVSTDIKWDIVNKTIYEDVTAKSGDVNGRKMRVQVVDGNSVVDLTGYTLNLGWKNLSDPTKKGLDVFTAVDITKGIFEITYTTAMLSNIGRLVAALQLVGLDDVTESNNFIITVKQSSIDADAIQTESSFTALTEALVTVNQLNGEFDAAMLGWGTEFDNTLAGWTSTLSSTNDAFVQMSADAEAAYIAQSANLDATYPTRLVSVEQQLEQAATKNELSQVASPLVASLASQMTNTTRVYVYTGAEGGYTAGNWYYHNGTAWVSGGVYQSTGIGAGGVLEGHLKDEIVTPFKTSFFNVSANLFNRKTALANMSINYGDGAISAFTGWNVSDYIPVKPSVTYKRSADTNMVYYNENKVRIGGVANGAGNGTFTTPANCYYIRMNVWASDILTSTFMVVEGDTLPVTFVAHTFTLDPNFPLVLPEEGSDVNVTCWGDSLTEGYGGGGTAYPSVLATLTGKTVNNMGISGEATNEIIARQGGYHAIANPFTIPATTTPVEITFKSEGVGLGGANPATTLGKKGTKGINPVSINGIYGNISYADTKSYFTRLTAGTETIVTRPTPIYANSALIYKDDIQVIFMGTNGGWIKTSAGQAYAIDSLIAQHDMMIDYNTSKKYIIIGMHYFYSWVTANGIVKADLEYALANKYGRHYINLREYMITYGLADAGITPTQADTDAIALGNVPPSLLYSDGLHGNAQFYTILANLVHERGIELGYW